ncbi:hypothetical protein ROHU_025545 [Labeo rohita]|uniref:Uncharacterized protein n=1 Tax=Labeo rohita TaxID=84645 RepID=A0A498MJN3_LABRO|nr:hypothetical protein ROHU_025545 [Labeo rohita]
MAENNIIINDSTNSDDDLLYFAFEYEMVIEIPVMILTLIALSFLIKSRPAASVIVSNLIFSDLIQLQ